MFEKEKEELRYNNDNWILYLNAIKNFKEKIDNHLSYNGKNQDLFFCNIRLCDAYINLNVLDKAECYKNQAINNINNGGNEDEKYLGIWTLAYSYEQKKEMDSALELYGRCIQYYEMVGNYKFAGCCLNNIGRIVQDENVIFEAIKFYQKVNDEDIIKKIDNAYDSVINIYINKNQLDKAKEYIEKIKGNSLKSNLSQQIYKLYEAM